MSFNPPGPPPGPSSRKVAIPRLQRPSQSKPSQDRRRVPRACTACRSHKIKCTGDVPQCKHCETTGRECIYILPRKDRLKSVTERCIQMAGLLRKLRSFADDEDSARIGELIEATEEGMIDTRQTPSNADTNDDDSRDSGAVFDGTTPEQSQRLNTESLDLLDENLHENDQSRATGFVGQSSEVQWLRSFLFLERVGYETTSETGSPFTVMPNEQVSAVTYYLDYESIELGIQVDPYGLPAVDVVENLLSVYMEKVHDSFPILPRKLFEDQCRKYFDSLRHGSAPRLNTKWQAILNLVLAIGAKYSHLVKASWQADVRDHYIYRTRACTLAWNDSSLEQHPELPQIQVAGLLAFYYLSVGQMSRAWTVVGMALRSAIALGLHVRNEDRTASGSKREVLIRVWWSLYHLERQISIITGRPSIVVEHLCSVPLPAPFSEQQILENVNLVDTLRRSSVAPPTSPVAHSHPLLASRFISNAGHGEVSPRLGVTEANAGSYFKAVVQLCTITQSIMTSLYTAGTRFRSPEELQQDIVQLGQRLDDWLAKLPSDLSFQMRRHGLMVPPAPWLRERTLLTFQFCSAKILLTRPCLGSFRRNGKHAQEATTPVEFPRRMAGICVDTAKAAIDVLPDQPHPRFLFEYGPWWTAVHTLMQALAVLLLALSYSSGAPQYMVVLAGYCRKIIRWLRSMDDPVAERAYRVALNCFEIIANRLSFPVLDELIMENQLSVPSAEHDFEMQLVHPGALPIAPSMTYGYARMPDDSFAYDPSVGGGMYMPPTDGRTYDESLYDYQDNI